MAYRRVFAHRRFLKACETALGIVHTAAHGIDIEKAEVNEVWAIKMLVFADCSERVAAFVVPQIRIGHFTATATVKHDDKNSFAHIFTLQFLCCFVIGYFRYCDFALRNNLYFCDSH